jgi:hypothetical protein
MYYIVCVGAPAWSNRHHYIDWVGRIGCEYSSREQAGRFARKTAKSGATVYLCTYSLDHGCIPIDTYTA